MLGRDRVQEDAGRIDAACPDDDDLGQHLPLGAGPAVEVLDALGEPAAIDQDAGRHRVGSDLEPAGLERERQQVIGGVEERRRVAARPAGAAVVTGRKASRWPRQVGAPAGNDRDAERSGGTLQEPFAAARRRRGLEVPAAGQRIGVVCAAAHANHLFDTVVVGGDVVVRDGPRNLPSVTLRPLEVEGRVAQADAPPDVRLAAVAPDPHQIERPGLRRQVRLLLDVEEELGRMLAPCGPFARLPGLDVRPELAAIEPPAGIEEDDLDPVGREVPGGHPSGGAAADDDHRMDLRGPDDLHGRLFFQIPGYRGGGSMSQPRLAGKPDAVI